MAGLRLTLQDFKPAMAAYNRQLFNIQIIVFLVLYVPGAIVMANEFYGIIGGALLTLFILALPTGIAWAASSFPFGTADVDVSGGNYKDAMVDLARSRGRPRGAFEFNMWLFMRISGLLLIFLAVFHMFWLHFSISVENITFDTLISRWTDPAQGAFWRSYDVLLLAFAFTHGMNGARRDFESRHQDKVPQRQARMRDDQARRVEHGVLGEKDVERRVQRVPPVAPPKSPPEKAIYTFNYLSATGTGIGRSAPQIVPASKKRAACKQTALRW